MNPREAIQHQAKAAVERITQVGGAIARQGGIFSNKVRKGLAERIDPSYPHDPFVMKDIIVEDINTGQLYGGRGTETQWHSNGEIVVVDFRIPVSQTRMAHISIASGHMSERVLVMQRINRIQQSQETRSIRR